ncbi:hypothetical protein H0I23_00770 [Cellulophaga sp. HaHaR_3_176]|uniref:hypothetical protein n=1 Tax=Cellulophaga sp. HaHaR_3_176 TaxID=1942464 RepID=UPI001C1F7FDF|nr:hypothetical protein [Cellulophaga sp. HaHaR_3_176]QWX84216.1 hypothetical protein H0I23_00770 [Cellulophaga sp. HaHaR_3_176]
MNFKVILLALATVFISCSNDKKTTEISKQVTKIKSDLLLANTVTKTFSNPTAEDTLTVFVNGKSLLESTITLKITNENGEEILCDTISTILLLNPDYRTANSALKEAQLRETIQSFFESEKNINLFNSNTTTYASAQFED